MIVYLMISGGDLRRMFDGVARLEASSLMDCR
jgi:hypothetical protein